MLLFLEYLLQMQANDKMSLCVFANACKRQDVTIYRHDVMSLCVFANACKRQDVTIYRHDVMSLCVIANACKRQDVFMCNIKLLIIINQTRTNQI